MARRYTLGCDNCGHPIPIETRQAGQVISCPNCQSSITVGTLRDIQALPGLTDESRRKILWDNCARLYRLGA